MIPALPRDSEALTELRKTAEVALSGLDPRLSAHEYRAGSFELQRTWWQRYTEALTALAASGARGTYRTLHDHAATMADSRMQITVAPNARETQPVSSDVLRIRRVFNLSEEP